MALEASTKRLPIAIHLPSGKIRGSDFLIPTLDSTGQAALVGIRSGKKAAHGMLAFTGISVSVDDIMTRVHEALPDIAADPATAENLQWYVQAVQEFRLGNIVQLHRSPDGGLFLKKVAERPPTAGKPKLPD